MKKILFSILLISFSTVLFAQENTRPTRSRFWNNNKSTFLLKPGDILVYESEDSGTKSPFLVTIKKFGDEISFDFKMPEKNLKRSYTMGKETVNNAVAYQSIFENKETLNNKSVLWLSKNNYKSLASAEKHAKMDFGNGPSDYLRQSASTQKINFKGREKILTVYNIVSEARTVPQQFSVLTELNNPLIVNMKGEMNFILKEVR